MPRKQTRDDEVPTPKQIVDAKKKREIVMGPEELRDSMDDMGVNATQLAKKLGVTDSIVSLWLSGDRHMKTPTATLIRYWRAEAIKHGKQPATARSA